MIVWDVQDLVASVYLTIQSSFITSGQRCVCARRLIISDNEYGKSFLGKLVEITKNIKVGAPQDSDEPFIGPVISKQAADLVMKAQADLVGMGAKELLACSQHGAFVTPGIIDVTGLELEDEEVFGPLQKVIRVKSFEEAIQESNNTGFGLSAGLISDDSENIRNLSVNQMLG